MSGFKHFYGKEVVDIFKDRDRQVADTLGIDASCIFGVETDEDIKSNQAPELSAYEKLQTLSVEELIAQGFDVRQDQRGLPFIYYKGHIDESVHQEVQEALGLIKKGENDE